MNSSVIVFPGSNCDRDIASALEKMQFKNKMVWHKETELPKSDLIVIPGGFSYGDYLRSGAIAGKSLIINEVIKAANNGCLILGICNGFQILTETGLLEGVLLRNKNLKTITIHKSKLRWTAGFKDIEINIGQTVNRLECEAELLMHESAHVELDWRHKGTVKSSKWKRAAIADNKYISDYAREFSEKEDVAETINWWIAVRCKKDRISETNYNKTLNGIPNRIKYLDKQKYDMYPLVCD